MSEKNIRYLLEIMIIPEDNSNNRKYVSAIAKKLGNILNKYKQTPNAQAIFNYCEEHHNVMDGFIEDDFLSLVIEPVGYNPTKEKPNSVLNAIEASDKRKVRIMLYPGEKNDVEDIKLPEATHNMIIRFDSSVAPFVAVESHAHSPSFYQPVVNDIIASLYIEALLVDASMCHFIGVSAAASHHDDEQNISSEKVKFLFDLVNSGKIDKSDLADEVKILIRYTVRKLAPDTPYVSFFSIFTIASMECKMTDNIEKNFEFYFSDYCKLWCMFQRWYFQNHGRVFSKKNCSIETIMDLFNRNKYQGQISPEAAQTEIKDILTGEIVSSPTLGGEGRYAFILLRNIPALRTLRKVCDSLFSGQIHQSKWTIKPWCEIEKFTPIREYIEIVPFILDATDE